jgi:hypothetical protein
MNTLVEKITQSKITSIFSVKDLLNENYKFEHIEEMLNDAVMNGDIVHIKDDIYTLSKMLRKELIKDEVLAQKLVPDSYVSMEFVLSQISWIPENVYTVTCVTNGENKNINTEYGRFKYINIQQRNYNAGVENIKIGVYEYKKATPLKALADIICDKGYNWSTLKPLYVSFRIEYDDLETLKANDFDELHETYGVKNVEDFLYGIRKELCL